MVGGFVEQMSFEKLIAAVVGLETASKTLQTI